jgi:hypothetical protein
MVLTWFVGIAASDVTAAASAAAEAPKVRVLTTLLVP